MRDLLAEDREIEIVSEAADGDAALAAIRRLQPDLALLDIHMPLLNGIETVTRLPAGERPHLIFVTAYDQHALKAFELQAVDYVAKPFHDSRFRAAVDRAKTRLRTGSLRSAEEAVNRLLAQVERQHAEAGAAHSSRPAPLVVKTDGELHFVEQADIRWIEAQGDYIRIHARQGKVLTRLTLAAVLRQLSPDNFVRIHKSTIINRDCVRCLGPTTAWGRSVELDDGTKLNISRGYRACVTRLL
jgi:two-component system LytT family response regulator